MKIDKQKLIQIIKEEVQAELDEMLVEQFRAAWNAIRGVKPQTAIRTYKRVKKAKKYGKAALDPEHLGAELVKSYGSYAPEVIAQAVKSRADAPEYEVGRGALAGCLYTPPEGPDGKKYTMRYQCKGKCPNAGEPAPWQGSSAEEEWKEEWREAVYEKKRCQRVCEPGFRPHPVNLHQCMRKR